MSVCSGLWALPKQLNWIIAFGRQTHVCLMNNASDVDTDWRQLANTTDRYVRRRQSDLLLSLMKQLVCMHRMWHTRWQWLLLMFFLMFYAKQQLQQPETILTKPQYRHTGMSHAHPELLAFVALMLWIRSLLAISFKFWITFASGRW